MISLGRLGPSCRSPLTAVVALGTDPAELIAKKIRKAQTDALGPVTIDREVGATAGERRMRPGASGTFFSPAAIYQNRPGVTNLVNMYAALSDEHGTAEAVVAAHATTSLESFKASLGDLVVQKLQPIQVRDQAKARQGPRRTAMTVDWIAVSLFFLSLSLFFSFFLSLFLSFFSFFSFSHPGPYGRAGG